MWSSSSSVVTFPFLFFLLPFLKNWACPTLAYLRECRVFCFEFIVCRGIIIDMQKSILFRAMFWVLFIVGVLNAIAYKLYLFWTVIWFDMVMHFLGGLFVVLFFFWVLSLFKSKLSYTEKLMLGAVFTILVGVAWEYFELIIRVTDLASPEYWGDTGMDIVMDTLGAVAGIVFVHNIEQKNV